MVEMWQRRVEWHLLLPIAQAFRHSHPHMAKMEDPQIPDWAAANRHPRLRTMMIFDGFLRDRPFVAGDRFTVADITGLVALDFARPARIAHPARARPSDPMARNAEGAAERGGVTLRPPKPGGLPFDGFERRGLASTGRRARRPATSSADRKDRAGA